MAAAFGLPRIIAAADEPKAAGAGPAKLHESTVGRADTAATVHALGTVEPEEVVDVGSQVNGIVKSFGADPHVVGKSINFGSQVEEGTVLATIDQTLYQATVDQNLAAVNSAKANLAMAKANQVLAEANLKRDDQLLKKGVIARNQYDATFAALEAAKADVGVQEAAIKQAVVALQQAEIYLDLTRIRSPIKGIVIDRRVTVGQTVGSGASSSGLFLIAKDLKKLQVWVSVREADIGKIHEKQAVRFTVDAFPGKSFEGKVAQIRLNAAVRKDVVTYTVVVATDNASGKLLPYLTANVQFEVQATER
jgi:HlyD family secretion protein